MWMLVNTTIFAEFYELEVMIGQSITLLEQRLEQESGCEVPPSTTSQPPTFWFHAPILFFSTDGFEFSILIH